MDTALDIIEVAQLVVFAAVGAVALRSWLRSRGEATMWMALAFGALALVFVLARILPEQVDSDDLVLTWARKVALVLLVAFPYLLHRFTATFSGSAPRVERLIAASAGAVAVWTLALPHIPSSGQARPGWFVGWIYAFLLFWTLASAVSVARLVRAARGQSSVPRNRMRMLGAGAVVFTGALLLAGSSPSTGGSDLVRVVIAAILVASAPVFYVGFAPPKLLRYVWRRREEARLRAAAGELIASRSPQDVADVLLPHVAAILGATGVLLTNGRGSLTARHGLDRSSALAALSAVASAGGTASRIAETPTGDRVIGRNIDEGWLVAVLGPAAPFFGEDEVELFEQLASYTELALQRADLYERERAARRKVEDLNEELEAFVYSVSHDLKNPLVSLVGYLEYLTLDFGEDIPAQGRHYIERMEASVGYMRDLIQDLLELSRIGRVETDSEPLDLRPLLTDIGASVEERHPSASVEIGDLVSVDMNAVRARQLFTNLIENAATHAGRDDVTVRIEARNGGPGRVEVRVSDDGVGILPEYQDKVFATFEQLDAGDGQGTGIGLTICRKIVEQAGGRIRVLGDDGGATFVFDLPRARAEDGGAEPESAQAARIAEGASTPNDAEGGPGWDRPQLVD